MGFMGTQRDGTFFGSPDWCVHCAEPTGSGSNCAQFAGVLILTIHAVATRRVDLKKKPGFTNISAVYPEMSLSWFVGW